MLARVSSEMLLSLGDSFYPSAAMVAGSLIGRLSVNVGSDGTVNVPVCSGTWLQRMFQYEEECCCGDVIHTHLNSKEDSSCLEFLMQGMTLAFSPSPINCRFGLVPF